MNKPTHPKKPIKQHHRKCKVVRVKKNPCLLKIKEVQRKIIAQQKQLSELVTPSAFRAGSGGLTVNLDTTGIGSQFASQLFFPSVQFDLNNEYDPSTSTFTPKVGGVYTISALAQYIDDSPPITRESKIYLSIGINGQYSNGEDDFILNPPQGGSMGHLVSINTIIHLNAGDKVDVFFAPQSFSGFGGAKGSVVGIFFAAARIPSPV